MWPATTSLFTGVHNPSWTVNSRKSLIGESRGWLKGWKTCTRAEDYKRVQFLEEFYKDDFPYLSTLRTFFVLFGFGVFYLLDKDVRVPNVWKYKYGNFRPEIRRTYFYQRGTANHQRNRCGSYTRFSITSTLKIKIDCFSQRYMPYFQKEVIQGSSSPSCALLEIRIDMQAAPLRLYKP